MLFADFGSESDLQIESFSMAPSGVSHPPMMPLGFLPVDVDDGPLQAANGRSEMPPQMRPRVALQRSGPPLFGTFGTKTTLAPSVPGTRTTPAPRVALTIPTFVPKLTSQPLSPLVALPTGPVDPYAVPPAAAKRHWGWYVLAGVGALSAIGGVFLLMRK